MKHFIQLTSIFIIYLIVSLPIAGAWTINSIQEGNITGHSADISWNTIPNATSAKFMYGKGADAGGFYLTFAKNTVQAAKLTNLDPNTRYYYKINVTDGTTSYLREYDGYNLMYFETGSDADTLAPKITSNITLSLPSDTSATISWTTNENADTRLYYGMSAGSLTNISKNSAFSTTHTATIQVVKGQKYFYIAGSCDSDNNCVNSTTLWFVAGQDNTAPTLSVTIPAKYGKTSITFTGKTESYAYVKLYLNSRWISQQTAGSDGGFTFKDISLAGSGSSATVKFVAIDQVGLKYESEGTMELNFVPPVMNVTITHANDSKSAEAQGSVDVLCTITYSVSNQQDTTAPAKVTGLHNQTVGTNAISLFWDLSTESDLDEYAIYRDDVRITSSRGSSFEDMGGSVGSGVQYRYSVSAVDKSCNEGPKSDEIKVKTLSGGYNATSIPTATNLTCDSSSYKTTQSVQGRFMQSLPLEQGTNYIKITATNEYGNSIEYTKEIVLDTEKPVITSTNLNRLSPTYVKTITIIGNVSEASTVYVYLNNQNTPSASVDVLKKGQFNVDVTLARDASIKVNDTHASGESSSSWKNTVKLIAVDKSGQKSESVTYDIIYALCGMGSWFSVTFHDQTPDMLSPRMMLEGMAQVGISVDVKWAGGDLNNVTISRINVNHRSLSIDEQKDWDTAWITRSPLWDSRNKTQWLGYVMLKIKAIDPSNGANWSTMKKEQNISSHRRGECLVTGLGCVKYPLEVEIIFQQPQYNFTQIQKTCVDIDATIEDRIPVDYIPESFLEEAVQFLNTSIATIDQVLVPLKTISLYTMYACLVMQGVMFIKYFTESYSCKFNALVASLGSSGFKLGAAQMGQCETVFASDDTAKDACKNCAEAITARIELENKMKWICDRTFCPSAPTFQKFVVDSQKKLSGDIKKKTPDQADKILTDEKILKSGLKYFDDDTVSHDCAFTDFPTNDYLQQNAGPIANKNTKCSGLHVPSKDCCKESYMQRWDSACVYMDEFKESACLFAQLTDHPAYVTMGDGTQVKCNVLWNAAAGFCDAKGGVKPDIIPTKYYLKSAFVEEDFEDYKTNRVDSRLYFRVSKPQEGDTKYLVEAGYLSKDISLASSTEKIVVGQPSTINSQSVFQPIKESPIENFGEFFDIEDDVNKNPAKGKQYNYEQFANELAKISCKNFKYVTTSQTTPGQTTGTTTATTSSRVMSTECNEQVSYTGDRKSIETLHTTIRTSLGIGDQKYVVDPTSTFMRSIQCACLPAVKSYLSLYRNMMMAVKNCFQTILVTGDGSSGMCRAVISVYVCDLLYDLIRCFAERYSYTSGRADSGSAFGNFFGAITEASNKVTSSVQGRYGGTKLFGAMFGENKIAHSLCMFAFTGTWDLDIGGIMDKDQYSIPVKSTGVIYPCERRFVTYDQTHSGISTWNYHMGTGLVAGADLTYRLKLICSADVSCNPQEGFPNGRCDCLGSGQKTAELLSGHLKTGETFSDEQFFNRQDLVRYDKAVIEWDYKDNNGQLVKDKAECTLHQTGGKPPAFCSFDISVAQYRCSVNVGQDSWAKFTGTPTARPPNGQYFVKGEPLIFDVPVTSKKPANDECTSSSCEYTKFLGVSIVQGSREVQKSDYYEIIEESPHTIQVQTSGLADTVFSTAGTYSPLYLNGKATSDVKLTGGNPTTQTTTTYVYFGHEAVGSGTGNWKILYSPTSKSNADIKSGWQPVSTTTNDGFVHDGITYTFYNFNSNQEAIWYYVYTKSTVDNCATGSDVTLKAVITIYNAKDDGSWVVDPSSIVTISGQKQQKEVSFKARCSGSVTPSTKTCPHSMELEWSQYSDLNGVTSCSCGKNTCSSTGTQKYCIESSICSTYPACNNNQGVPSSGQTPSTKQCQCSATTTNICNAGDYCYAGNKICSPTMIP